METIRYRSLAREGARYFGASVAAFAVDFGAYVALIRLAGWHYLAAAPVGFAAGLLTIYYLSVRWVFRFRRFQNARLEFSVFAGIGLIGMALNEAVLYGAVDHGGVTEEPAKVISAAIVFAVNFALRKVVLFTRREAS